VKDSFAEVE